MRSWRLLLLLGACGVPTVDDPGGPGRGEGDTDTESGVVLVDPGRVALRRLTRSEYDRTVRDLVGLDLGLGSTFPVDDATEGFDVVASGLAISPLHVELYERSAAQIVTRLLDRPLTEPVAVHLELEDGAFTAPSDIGGPQRQAYALWSAGSLSGTLTAPADGTYRIELVAWASQAGPELAQVEVAVGFEAPVLLEVDATSAAAPGRYGLDVVLPRGRHPVVLSFVNDFYGDEGDRNVYLDALDLRGPTDLVPQVNEARDRWIVCDPEAPRAGLDARSCIALIVGELAPVAWRRPLQAGELDDLLRVTDQVLAAGDPPTWALEFALRAVFASPHFVLHVEPPPPAEGLEPLPDHALASRLSYLLWSSAPDRELRTLADAGRLNSRPELVAQVERMLQDPRAAALADDFAGQWLLIRAVDDPTPDFFTYPLFNERLRASMKASMLALFQDLVTGDEPMQRLLDGEFAYVDRALADVYGLPAFGFDEELERLDLGGEGRRGWLTQPGVLMATSYPTRTSPVKRGVWVMSALLCDEPEPPPAGVEGFPEEEADTTSVRQRLEAHRAKPQCASCHDAFDPIGLAFEGYDGLGKERTVDGGQPIDATGELPDGTVVDGVADLAAVLAEDERFARCVVEKAFTYAHRRAPVAADEPYLDEALRQAERDGFSLRAVLTALVTSDTFRMHGVPR